MAKPIFIAGIPRIIGNSRTGDVRDIQKMLEEKFADYHVLVYLKCEDEGGEPDFQVFYEKDFDEVKYEELKEIVRAKIDEQQES